MSGDSGSDRTRLQAAPGAPPWFRLALITTMVALSLSASSAVTNPVPVNHSFTITGVVQGLLAPDATVPVDLSLTNPNNAGLSITKLTARLEAVQGGLGTCTLADFKIDQYSGRHAITVAALSTRSLGDLDINVAQWPQLTMVNRAVNQDGCKSATIAISFTAEGTELTG